MPALSKRIVPDCFYLLIFYFEKFSTDVCRLPCAVNVNLNLSIDLSFTYNQPRVTSGYERFAWVFSMFDKITLRFAVNMLFWFCSGMGHFAHFY